MNRIFVLSDQPHPHPQPEKKMIIIARMISHVQQLELSKRLQRQLLFIRNPPSDDKVYRGLCLLSVIIL